MFACQLMRHYEYFYKSTLVYKQFYNLYPMCINGLRV